MRFLDDTEIAEMQKNREEWVAKAATAYDWENFSIGDLALIRAQAQELVRLADAKIQEHVSFLRFGGEISWAELGKVLGVSKQAAQQKFGA